MNIKYKLNNNGNGVIDTEIGANIPVDINNRHWQEYLNWLASGNTPDPADQPPEPGPLRRVIDGSKISGKTRQELVGATSVEGLKTVLSEILLGRDGTV